MKIPSHATRVFKGVIYDVYQWEQEMFDRTKTIFESLKRPNTVIVIPMDGDQIFYAQQEQPGKAPYVSLFGGSADDGEEPLDTAKRELLEETGMTSTEWELLRSYSSPTSKIEWTIYYFVARKCVKTANPKLDGGEKLEILKMKLDKFIADILPTAGFKEIEMQKEIISAFNPEAAEKFKQDILGTK